jgi:hypothetical protein
MTRRSEAGSSVVTLLVLLLILAGAGAWNFRRNLAAEEAEYRPFRGHSDEAIGQLMAAYEGQHEHDTARYQAAADRKVNVHGKDYFGEQVEEFERVQRLSKNTRALRDELAESQATLKLLEEERSKRAQERQKLQLFLKRVFTLNF